MVLPLLVTFGAISPWPGPNQLDELRHALKREESLEPIIRTIKELPSQWQDLSIQDPNLNCIPGEAAANQLVQWVDAEAASQAVEEKGNLTLMPLTIILHVAHYLSFLRQQGESHESVLQSVVDNGGVQGFCIGLLSAVTVASSKTQDDIGRLAALSLRLAFCIGAYVDLDRHFNDGDSKASTFAVRWKTPTTLDDIQSLLFEYPEAYIAVVRDIRDATVTFPSSVETELLADLSHKGVTVRDTGVYGRYHVNVYKGISWKIFQICQAQFDPTFNGRPLIRSNTDAKFLSGKHTTLSILECILGERADWYLTMSAAASPLSQSNAKDTVLSIGTDAVPHSIAKVLNVVKTSLAPDKPVVTNRPLLGYPKDAIAIIGMSCRFPGADSLDEFWDLLVEGNSMLSEVPKSRFGLGNPARSSKSLRFWGNFLRDIDTFDHGFFKKSPREAMSMDPQQRILLQIAYEALESSGYFSTATRPEDVGCYIGACATDYDFNVASHPPTAYSAIGTLRSFLSGKLSHYFGWSGPSLVIDTACSSSAVAVHTACTALRTGQCSQALAGGITLMTSPYLFENFSAAHFISPTGGSKPFSADADGYGRGEGGGLVVLKRLSDAVRDNDHILGVIGGSAVNQNDNCVPITVPHTSSQGNLYQQVSAQAGVRSSQVSFVEAHGTGTPVGDPIEMESIRRVFGGPDRETPLIVSSVKGNIGHLEGASGVAAIIKAILQMEHRLAPRQASFKSLNPKIPALESDNLCIPTSSLPLASLSLTACVNNYGAAGSNAAMIILEPPRSNLVHCDPTIDESSRPRKFPIRVAAASHNSLLAYCNALDKLCDRYKSTDKPLLLLSSLAYHLNKRLNLDLPFNFTTSTESLDQLQTQLRKLPTTIDETVKKPLKGPPLVLCFGGQVSDKVALDKRLWQVSRLLRSHLDLCDNALRSMGYPGIYPGIFQTEAVDDVVILHSALFATQYSCAQAWMESGLEVDAVVGHSFGQLTAMCVSGILSLQDGLRLIAGRASLMQKYWGAESGTMIAVETDEQILRELQGSLDFEIACYNGPTSHVVVSDRASADRLESKMAERSIRYRTLDVPYGMHSRFTEPLLSHLQSLASSLAFKEPKIPLETCTKSSSWTEPSPTLVTAHTRDPVFFNQAIQRLQAKLGPCTWLEAGSDSSVVGMVRRALGQSSAMANTFMPMQLNKSNSTELLVDATIALWNTNHRVQFWNFHKLQNLEYNHLRLPPYMWDKSRHWLELDMSTALSSPKGTNPFPAARQIETPPTMIHLDSSNSSGYHFLINPCSEEYQTIFDTLEQSPSSLYILLAHRALTMVIEGKGNELLSIRKFHLHSALRSNAHQSVRLDLQSFAQGWKFNILSNSNSRCDAEGIIDLRPTDATLEEEFRRYQRLTAYDNFDAILVDPRTQSITGEIMYKMLARAIKYPDWYRGVKRVATLDSRVIATVKPPHKSPKIVSQNNTLDISILENFFQVTSLHSNCLYPCSEEEIFQITGADYLCWGHPFNVAYSPERAWNVVAYFSLTAGKLAYDIFVYDTATGRLVLLMLGVHLENEHHQPITVTDVPDTSMLLPADVASLEQPPTVQPTQDEPRRVGVDAKTSIFEDICGLLEELADIPRDQLSLEVVPDDAGVDSLMMIEVIGELSKMFQVELPIDELEQLTTFGSLVDYLHGRGCVGNSYVEGGYDASSSESNRASSDSVDSSNSSALTTPPEYDKAKPEHFLETTGVQPLDLGPFGIQNVFMRLRFDIENYYKETGALGFWSDVYPQQADLVCSYVVDAYLKLGCDLWNLNAGQKVPKINALPKHKHLMAQLERILVDSDLLELKSDQVIIRTARAFDATSTKIKFERMLEQHPLWAPETRLMNVTGSRLADCLMGKAEPLSLLFGDKHNREFLADFYANSRMVNAATHLLAEFVQSTFSAASSRGTLRILEVGAGTGGTTKYLVDFLIRHGAAFEYCFTDISTSLVSQAKKSFAGFPQMSFRTFNCDHSPPQELAGKFHLVISTNCIHATSNIATSTSNILPILREDGALCLLENTRNLYWFDLVFGLLEGWWLFSDGRQHALVDERFWDRSLRAAGFKHVTWTDGKSEEAQTLRLICAFKGNADENKSKQTPSKGGSITKRAGVPMEEVVWKRVGTLELSADLYYPKTPDPPGKRRPIALLIHGGGHFLFGRKDVPMKHIRTLIERGFLPVSTDYRLCPETNLFEGPMTDCCDALEWATGTLPMLSLSDRTVKPDANKVVAFGWSSGGQLAMSLGYIAPTKGIKAPDAIFALYPPSDMESDHWHKPCFPLAAEEEPTEVFDILAGVRENPIIEYAPVSEKRTMALSLTLKDDRAKIILHMCWESQTIPILIHGLPHKKNVSAQDRKTDWRYLPPVSAEQVQAISPLWQIKQGNYKTPTFIVHGNGDDWLPLSMSEGTVKALEDRGIPTRLAVPEQCGHAFDLFPVGDPLDVGWAALEQGYDFICEQLGLN